MVTTVKQTGERVDVYRDRRDIRSTPLGDEMAGWIYREYGSDRTWPERELNVTADGRSAIPGKDRIAGLVRHGAMAAEKRNGAAGTGIRKETELLEQIAAATEGYVMIVPATEQDRQPEKKGRRTKGPGDTPERCPGKEIILTDRQTAWLILHFKNTENAVLAAKLGICESTLHRLARKYGLKKTKQFMRKCNAKSIEAIQASNRETGYARQREAAEKQWEDYRSRGEKPSGCFPPGTSIRDRYGEEVDLERRRKAGQTRREIFRKERMRLSWGLEQKTRLNVKLCPMTRQQTNCRCNMKKRGYIVRRGEKTIYWNEQTSRSTACEANARKYGITIEQWRQ